MPNAQVIHNNQLQPQLPNKVKKQANRAPLCVHPNIIMIYMYKYYLYSINTHCTCTSYIVGISNAPQSAEAPRIIT